MNKLKIIFLLLRLPVAMFSKAPDMEFFVPTEYMYMTQLDNKETELFIKENENIFEMCQDISYHHLEERHCPEQNVCFDETKIYKETVNEDTFYWILVPGNRMDETKEMMRNVSWVSEKHYFLGLVRVENGENKLLMFHPTFHIDRDERSEYYFVTTYQIIKGKDKNKGVVLYKNSLAFYRNEQGTKFDKYQERKKQPVGVIKRAGYYLFENEPQEQEYCNDLPGFVLKNWPRIMIQASDFLWDLKNPLKYGLQNAFDVNPATSYVENTEDDLMTIDIWLGKPVDKMAIINGYASNSTLYKNNNRIKEVGDYFKLKDSILDYQFIPCRSTNINFTDKYIGKKYNDTCLAELNYYYEGQYLFGDISEQ